MIKDIIDMNGIQPQVRELLAEMNVDLSSVNSAFASHSKAMSGDVVIAVDPATCGSSAEAVNAAIGGEAGKFQRTVHIALADSEGNVYSWFEGSLSIAATKSSTSGVVAIDGGGASVSFTNGEADVKLNYTGEWAAADTCTLTVSGSVLGYTLTNATSVDTLVA